MSHQDAIALKTLLTNMLLQANIELSPGVQPEIVARWQTREADFWIFGLILLALGVLITIAAGAKILSIMKSTEHPDGP